MIMPKSSDLLQTGICEGSGIRWRHVDVTDSARALSQAHLCGPTAGLVLAEALGGVALLIGELGEPEEVVSLRLQVNGPIEGLLVEAAGDGALRGYTNIKILNDLDGQIEVQSGPALGDAGQALIMRSLPGRVLSRAGLDAIPPTIERTLNQYFEHSLQRVAFVAIQAFADADGVDIVRAFWAECMPDGDRSEFERLHACTRDGSLHDALEYADGAKSFCESLSLTKLCFDPPRALRFACRCTRERVREALHALPPETLIDMAASGQSSDIICHMCGRSFAFDAEALLLASRRSDKDDAGESPHA